MWIMLSYNDNDNIMNKLLNAVDASKYLMRYFYIFKPYIEVLFNIESIENEKYQEAA